ncbi:MAG: micrococcal nuclease-like protein [Firmicutes bacterium]|nr:micrococcal nuclease-like protein [Bacillota bacterium]
MEESSVSVFLLLCGVFGGLVGVISLFRPIALLRIHRRSTAAAVLLLSFVAFILGALWDSALPRWVSCLTALGLVGMAAGILNVIRPINAWRVTKRKTGGVILGGSFVLLIAAMIGSPQPPMHGQTAVREPAVAPAPAQTKSAGAAPVPVAPIPVPIAAPQPPAVADATPASSQPNSSSTGTATEATAAPTAASPAAPAGLADARVVRVVDGDTIEVESAGQTFKVRLIGVNTPETVDPHKPVEPFGPEASAYTKQRLSGQSVRLEYDVEHNDHYGRALAYVWLGQELFNATLVQEGYAQIMTIPPNVKYVDQFHQLQVSAREGKRGMWGMDVQPAMAAEAPPAPAPARKPAPAPAPAPAPTPVPASKTGRFAPRNGQCVENGIAYIKGNRSSMIYHTATGQFYDKTNAEDCFYTSGDAVAAGYRASKR